MAAEIQGQATANGLAGLFLQETNDWYAWFYERETILFATGNANQEQSGLESQSSIGEISVEAELNGFIAIFGVQSESAAQPIEAQGGSVYDPQGLEAGSDVSDSVFSNGTAIHQENGVQAETSLGNIAVETQNDVVVALLGIEVESEIEPVNITSSSIASVLSVQAQSSVKTLEFSKPDKRKIGGQTLIRPVQDRDAIAKVKPLLAVALAKKIKAEGITVQNGTAKIIPIESATLFFDVQATGVLDISEDEILLLLAA